MFKALLLEKDDAGFRAGVRAGRRSRAARRRRAACGRAFDAQLQGRPRDHRQEPGRSRLADGRRHRRRRHGARVEPSGLEARRPLRPQRLGRRRDALGLPRRARPPEGRWLVTLPAAFSTRQAMAIGTAGGKLASRLQFRRPRRQQTTVGPRQLHRRPAAPRREGVADDAGARVGFEGHVGFVVGGCRLDGRWRPELQRPERRVEDVAAHVAEGAGSEVPPAAPLQRVIRRDGRAARRPAPATGPSRALSARAACPSVGPARSSGHGSPPTGRSVQAWTSRTSPIAPSRATRLSSRGAFGGVALVAHLGDDLRWRAASVIVRAS